MATGLLRPDGGTARVLGHDVWRDPAAAKAVMGVAPDGMRLFEQLSGRELLTYVGALRRMPRDVTAAARRRAARRARPRRRRQHRRRRLLRRHGQEDQPGRRAHPRTAAARARRAVRGGRPGVRADDPHDPAPLRRERRHRRHVEPRHGARRGPVRPGRRHRRRAGARRGHHRAGSPAAAPSTSASSSSSGRPTPPARGCRGWADGRRTVRRPPVRRPDAVVGSSSACASPCGAPR